MNEAWEVQSDNCLINASAALAAIEMEQLDSEEVCSVAYCWMELSKSWLDRGKQEIRHAKRSKARELVQED